MRIGCLAWGSLVWDPRTLPMADDFRHAGPRLPIEFSRVALDGRVTLVIDPAAPGLQTFWVPLDVTELEAAIDALGERERIPSGLRPRYVGALARGADGLDARGETPSACLAAIGEWLEHEALDAVLWTALPSRTPGGELAHPSYETLLAHLRSLEGGDRARAEEYIRRTPRPIRTPRRARFEAHLGWHPVD